KAFNAEPYYLGSVNPFAIEKAEQHDPQVQQKSVTLLSRRVGQIRGYPAVHKTSLFGSPQLTRSRGVWRFSRAERSSRFLPPLASPRASSVTSLRSSCEYQPHTTFSAKRPPVKWSTV